MNHRSTQHRRTAALGAVAVALCAAAVSQAQEPAPPPNSGAHFLPLAEGTTWTWHVTRDDGDRRTERDETSVVWGEVPARDGTTVAQLRTTRGEHVSWSYWAARDDGVHVYRNAYLGRLRGAGRDRERLLPAPVGATSKWEWDEQRTVQTMGGGKPPDPESLRVHHQAELLAMTAPVTVPAGSYRAVHVRIVSTGASIDGELRRDVYFARGTGIVKEEHTGTDVHQVRELTAFTLGTAQPLDAEPLLRAWRTGRPELAVAEVEWLSAAEAECYVRGRFAILRLPDRASCVLVDAGGVTEFAVDDAALWTRLLRAFLADQNPAEDGAAPARTGNDLPMTTLMFLAARLHGAVLGCTGLESGGSTSRRSGGAAVELVAEGRMRGVDPRGDPVLVRARMTVAGDRVTDVTLAADPAVRRR